MLTRNKFFLATLGIKRILLTGAIILALIWGVIFYLVLTDSSYHLFLPAVTTQSAINKMSSIDFSQNGIWKQDLFMASGNLNSFDGKSFIAHGAATPSAVVRNNQLLVYFNYFPQNQRKGYSMIHLVKSDNQGRSWSEPIQMVMAGSPGFDTVPFSPKVVVTQNNKIKLYFLAKKHGDDRTKMYAAISDDGQNFIYDRSTQFEIENESLISAAVSIVNDRMHLLAYTAEGYTNSTAYHAISYDTNVFTRLADVTIKDSTYGQSTMLFDGNNLILIGNSHQGLWSSSSGNGNSWGSPHYLSFNAQNPGIVKLEDRYLLFYTDI